MITCIQSPFLSLHYTHARAQVDLMVLEGKLRTMQGAAAARDMGAVDKRLEVVEQAAAMRARVTDLEGHMKRADLRQRRLMTRAEELRWGTPGGRRPAYSKFTDPGVKGSASTRYNTQQEQQRQQQEQQRQQANTAAGASQSPSSGAGAGGGSYKAGSSAVEEELQKLKKQMGL